MTLDVDFTPTNSFFSLACSETENPPLWGMGIVAATVATSFLMSLATKEFSVMVSDYNGNISPGLMALGIALLQVIIIALVFRIGNLNFSTSPANREAVIFAAFAHAGAMFLISYRHWDSVTGSSVFYGAQEPVLCMSLLLIAAGISTDLFKFGAVAAMSIGAALLTADFNIYLDRTALIRIVTSLFFLTRNIVVKHLYDSNVNIMLRGQSTVISVGGCATVTAVFFTLAAERALLPATLVMIAGCFMSAMLLHLTMVMLTLYDNLTVAVFMLWGQVLENAVFVVGVSRPDIISVILGALLFAGGHYVYFKEGLDSGTIHLNIKRGMLIF